VKRLRRFGDNCADVFTDEQMISNSNAEYRDCCKSPSTPATMSNEFIAKCHPFDKVECCRIAGFGKKCRTKFRPFHFVEVESRNKFNIGSLFILFRLCQKDEISLDIVAKNGNSVAATFDFVERIVRLPAFEKCCFDIVAGVDGA